jgi:sugar phosphate permease
MKSNSVWFHERVFGIMSGLTLLFGNLGSVLAAGPLAMMLTTFAWRTVFVGIGFVSLTLALLGHFIVNNRPEDLGFKSPNFYASDDLNKTKSKHWLQNLGSVVMMVRLWPGFWVQFGMIGALYSFMGLWGVPYLRDVHGLTTEYAAEHITVMLLCFALGSLFFGWFSDRIGKRKPLIVSSVMTFILSWLLFMYTPWSQGTLGFIIFGFLGFSGSGFVLTFAAAKETAHPELSGMAVSVVNTGGFLGTALMQPLFGYIADFT